ncbi:hypothetical protein BGZ83_001512 [Gryganskiella cystojenkinii]|nr:hypothetical protein BGZ83_001512 [Gryganskiella cystojenkinii]
MAIELIVNKNAVFFMAPEYVWYRRCLGRSNGYAAIPQVHNRSPWQSEFGKPDDNKEDFENMYKYSPLHNVTTSHPYPPVALFTSSHDYRVVLLHTCAGPLTTGPLTTSPLLIRVDTRAGHGAGKLTDKRIAENTDQYSFVAISLGIKWRE